MICLYDQICLLLGKFLKKCNFVEKVTGYILCMLLFTIHGRDVCAHAYVRILAYLHL